MQVASENSTYSKTKPYQEFHHNSNKSDITHLLIIWCPDATGDLTLQVNLGGPVSLSTDRADQDKAVPVRDECLSAIMWPSEVTHLKASKHSQLRQWCSILPNVQCVGVSVLRRQQQWGGYLGSSVVHQLHRPSSFILDPDKNASFHITGGQLLKGFIPAHQDNLQKPQTQMPLCLHVHEYYTVCAHCDMKKSLWVWFQSQMPSEINQD